MNRQPRLCDYTTMQVGGRASQLVNAACEADVVDAARDAQAHQHALHPLGGGSNVVVSDDGVKGTVLKISLPGVEMARDGESVLVTAAAGEIWHDFAAQMTAEGFSGIECLGGIPGAVGGTPIQNVGAYGQEVSETIVSVRALDRETLTIRSFTKEECQFVYRGSYFKASGNGRYVILSVTFRLTRGGDAQIRYGELSKALAARSTPPSLEEVFRTVVALRREKSMVLSPDDENRRSCGSFFVNAQVTDAVLKKIRNSSSEPPPAFLGEHGLTKVPSAWLIERAGLHKGMRRGHVGLSTKHTLALVAHEGALASDIIDFAWFIRETVEDRFGVRLIPEPNFWGFSELVDGLPRK